MTNSSRPNILHISWHDAGRHFGCYGIKTVHTPNVDRLAAGGVRFTQAFSCGTVCSPSRGGCLSGLYPQSNGLMHLAHNPFNWRMRDYRVHMGHRMSSLGYRTVLHGFQHEVAHAQVDDLGFAESFHTGPQPPIYPVPPASIIARGAADWLQSHQHDEAPFYLQLGFFESHRPYDFGGAKPDDSLGVTVPSYLVDNEYARRDHAELQGAIRQADDGVGIVLDALDRLGMEENTIVIFTPDHGLANPRAKATLYDPGLSIACLFRWPQGGIPAGKVDDRLVSNVDVVPTIYDLIGEAPDPAFEGQSVAGALGREEKTPPREAVYALHLDGERRMVRTTTHKLIGNFYGMRSETNPYDMSLGAHHMLQKHGQMRNVGPIEFYDLREDPEEIHDLSQEPGAQEELTRHKALLFEWLESVNDPVLQGPTRTPRWEAALAERNSRA